MSIYYVSLFIVRKLYLSYKFRMNLFVIFCNTIICYSQVHIKPLESVDLQQRAKIEGRGFIRGRQIVVREIVNLI